jgi:epidermal growth factor receptor substrate 15
VAIAVDTSTAWEHDFDTNGVVTTPSFNAGAGTVILLFVAQYYANFSGVTITNSGTALTWAPVGASADSSYSIGAYYAVNASAQTGMTVTFTGNGFSYASAIVYVVSGANTGSPIGNGTVGASLTGTTVTVPTGTVNSTVTGSLQFVAGSDDLAQGGLMSSSNLTYSSTVDFNYALTGYKALGSAPEALSGSISRTVGTPGLTWLTFEVKPAGGSSLTAAAALSTAATISPAAGVTRPAAAALSTTATVSPAAALTKFGAAALSTAAAITPAITRTAGGAAALSTAATLTASATVTSPGSIVADSAVSSTATITPNATVTRALDAALSTTVGIAPALYLARPGAAALSTTLALSASMTIAGQSPTTQGYMRAASPAVATMRPRGGVTAPTIAALLSIDTATMTAVVDTTAQVSPLGVPVFVGGSVSPVAAGLIASGIAYVWFADDGIHVQGAS